MNNTSFIWKSKWGIPERDIWFLGVMAALYISMGSIQADIHASNISIVSIQADIHGFNISMLPIQADSHFLIELFKILILVHKPIFSNGHIYNFHASKIQILETNPEIY